jgi:hypothetical protein
VLTILAYSALVSVATLAVLLLRRDRPTQIGIWTFRYGSTEAATAARLKVTSPPWFLWFLTALITTSFGAAYYRDQSTAVSHAEQPKTSVWIDRSLSTQSILNNEPSLRSTLTDRVFALSSNPTLIQSTTRPDPDSGEWRSVVTLLPDVSRDSLSQALLKDPAPYAFDLSPDGLKQAFEAAGDKADQHGRLLVISDGQRASVQRLSGLSDLFSEIILIDVPSKTFAVTEQQEIAPATLLVSWGLSTQQPSDGSQWTQENILKKIPSEARPGVFLGAWRADDEPTNRIPSQDDQDPERLEFFSIGSGFLETSLEANETSQGVLFTHCSSTPAGPSELSPVSDLQALARFFQVKIRTMPCREDPNLKWQEGRAATDASASTASVQPLSPSDPWIFRRSSLWLVPLSDQVYNTLLYQNRLWLPEGFRQHTDALFYYAEPGLLLAKQAQSGLDRDAFMNIRKHMVQFDKSGVPMGIMLAPPPPIRELEDISGSFTSVAQTHDRTDLIYQLGQNSVFYLRTPLAMPNGELGRTGFWPSFWLRALSRASSSQGGIVVHHMTSPEALALPPASQLHKLHADSLVFSDLVAGGAAPPELTTGLYKNKNSGVLHLVEYPPSERSGQILDARGLRESVPTQPMPDAARSSLTNTTSDPDSGSQRTKQTPWYAIFGALAGAMALVLFWHRLSRSHRQQPTLPFVVLAGLGLASGILGRPALAQGLGGRMSLPAMPAMEQRLPEPMNVAFRIGWCAANPPNKSKIASGYRNFARILADRGTIHLQQEIIFGACVPGASEIWWTDSPNDLDPGFLKTHVQSGGIFVVEGLASAVRGSHAALPIELAGLEEPSVGLRWEQPEKRGMLYRSFYLIQTFDGCLNDTTMMLTLRKKQTAKSPVGLITGASFFGGTSDCFKDDQDYRARSFVNLMYAFLTTDYKEDQLQLPELLRRVRNLGLEP